MSYDIEKLIDILTIFSRNQQDLDKMRISKLLYFIDKNHLQKYGSVILNDRYHRLSKGPIPSLALDLLNELFDPEFKHSVTNKKIDKSYLSEYLEPYRKFQFKLKKESNFNSLSKSEIEVIDYVLTKYGSLTTEDLVELSHKDATWLKTKEPNEIDYCLFLEGMPEEKRKIVEGLLAIDKENEVFSRVLNNDCYTG